MNELSINYAENKTGVQKAAGNYLAMLINENLSSGGSVLFMVSGGSSLGVLDYIDLQGDSSNLTISVVDERFDERLEHNNCAQVLATNFWEKYGDQIALIDTQVVGSVSHGEHAENFESDLKLWRENNPNGVIITLLGVGGDGHTSGVLPGFTDLWKTNNWVAAYDIGAYDNPEKKRTTTTPYFIQTQIDYPVIFMCGADKLEAYKALLQGKGSSVETPCLIFRDLEKTDTVPVFTDIDI